jgi:hypothetical protein
MNQTDVVALREVSHFACLSGVYIRAVLQQDTNVTLFAGESPRRVLHEVWLMPEGGDAFTPNLLSRMCVNSTMELAAMFDPVRSTTEQALFAYKKQREMVEVFAPDADLNSRHFYYGTFATKSGPVVQVVFGDKRSMQDFERAGFDLEPSE